MGTRLWKPTRLAVKRAAVLEGNGSISYWVSTHDATVFFVRFLFGTDWLLIDGWAGGNKYHGSYEVWFGFYYLFFVVSTPFSFWSRKQSDRI